MTRLSVLLAVAYPFLILGGLRVLEPRHLVVATGALLAVRGFAQRRRSSRAELRRLALPIVSVALLLGLGWLWNDPLYLMFLPALVSLALLAAFARTLLRGPTMVETFARLRRGELSPARVKHCRQATFAWCGFFLINATACVLLALFASAKAWALYTGGIAYLVMGLLFAGEFVVRALRFEDEPAPALLRRLLARGGES